VFEGVFAHSGSDGTAAWVDPKNQLIVLVFTQSPAGNKLRDRFFKLVQLSIK
jgi:CubicO group peptidase (beta-lactamase class C family)